MIRVWRISDYPSVVLILLLCLLFQNLNPCTSLNSEGLALLKFKERIVRDRFGALANWKDGVGVTNPCSWSGVECVLGNVVQLNLKDSCLQGTLPLDLGNLVHIKSIVLRNNSFYGTIPQEIGDLKELEVLDLGYNNFTGPVPSNLGNNLSLTILLLDHNGLLGVPHEIHEIVVFSEVQVDENHLSRQERAASCSEQSIPRRTAETKYAAHRGLLQIFPPFNIPVIGSNPTPLQGPVSAPSPSPSPSESPSFSPSPSFTTFTVPTDPKSKPKLASPPPTPFASSPAVDPSPQVKTPSSNHHMALIMSVSIGGPVLLFILGIAVYLFQGKKVAVVRPWATGLSGQLQKALVTGVPKLKRSEIEVACEDFSNVVSSSSVGTVYKGTLSSGVEIAVTSVAVASAKDWTNSLERQFRNKIDTLSKVNHKNFVNLIGFCEENEPFTRMLVFEYAPNGTLFEHLHIKEAEHLDWGMRTRIMMGMAYCLDHMHQMQPPIVHKNLNSSSVYLCEDYAAKVADMSFWIEDRAAAEIEPDEKRNVYSFGVVLFEMFTGKLPYSADNGSLEDWASDYLRGEQPLRERVDPTLASIQVEQLEEIGQVVRLCVDADPNRRPRMRQVTTRLREITGIGPDGAIPRLSPLWWAELEIISTEA